MTHPRRNRDPKAIVGIGASAGGLSAIRSFLEALPGQSGLACIVVQHADPQHDSNIAELAARWTRCKVVKAGDGMAIEPDHVYFPPPGRLVSISKGRLRLATAEAPLRANHSIDFLFRSLAADQGGKAVGIVMSGMLDDGAVGLRTIRERGGLSLVQDPATAEFDGIPRAAIEAEAADVILAPQEMPAAIADYLARVGPPASRPQRLDQHSDNQAVGEILDLLSAHEGRDFRGYKKSTLLRRVERRMGLCSVADLGGYLEVVRKDREEARRLAKDLLIGVTAFFRDGKAYRILETRAIPQIFAGKDGKAPIRAWVAGCSTGQEAYSVAMLLYRQREKLGVPNPIHVFATDVDEQSLEIARGGFYSESEIAELDPHYVEQFFTRDRQGYRVKKELRETIVFAPHNLVSDPPFSRLDLIVCRNVLIYLEPETQAKLLTVFHFVLNVGGFLFLGSSEALGAQSRNFEVVSKPWRLFRNLDRDRAKKPEMPLLPGTPAPRASLSNPREPHQAPGGNERFYANLLKHYGPALVLADEQQEVLFTTGNTADFLRVPSGEVRYRLSAMLEPGLLRLVRSVTEQVLGIGGRAVAVGTWSEDGKSVRVAAYLVEAAGDTRLLLLSFEHEPEQGVTPVPLLDGSGLAVQQLEQELQATRDDLQGTIEQLRSSNEDLTVVNEEVVAMNEELQSANEELESSKEELQSLNEELLTSNNALDAKVAELETANDDLSNLFSSTDIATLFLDTEFRIKRYTPASQRLMHLLPGDIGRPVSDIAHALEDTDLVADARRVLATRQPLESEAKDSAGRWYLKRVLPYRTAGGRVAGVVVTFSEVTSLKRAKEAMRESEERFRQVAETLPQVVWLVQFHAAAANWSDYRLLYVSPLFEDIWGCPARQAYDNPTLWAEAIHPDDRERVDRLFLEQAASGGFDCEYRIVRPDGQTRYIHDHGLPIRNAAGEVYRIAGVAQDITERKFAEDRLRQAAAVYESTSEGVVIADPEGNILAVNRAFSGITGYPESEVLGLNPRLLHSGRQGDAFYKEMWRRLRQNGRWQGEIWNRRKNGEIYPEWLTINGVRNAQGELINYVAVFSDISAIKQSELQLERMAHYDLLTGLPNRLLLLSRLKHTIEHVERHGHLGAVLFLDLDRFKDVNDSFGHPLGDELLCIFARRLGLRIRQEDTLARLGGDEFVIVMEHIEFPEDAASLAQELLELLAEPFTLANHREVYIGASIGISLIPGDGRKATELIQHADAAMYKAKESGRNTYRFYTEELTRAANERLDMEARLRRALERNEFVLHYQPQVDMASARITGFEALVRWQPDGGLPVEPARFIPLAEATGLIVPLGEWVLRTACEQAQRWNRDGLLAAMVAVNLSPRQFSQLDLVQRVRDILQETGLAPERLELEITESAIMERREQAEAILASLKQLGVSLAIDDFGTGYSSLAYLKRFSIDKLKIDQSFVRDIPQDRNDMEIAAAIIAMGRSLRLKVLAEGVETQEQLEFLRSNGCDAYQGYLFSRPVAAGAFEQLLRD